MHDPYVYKDTKSVQLPYINKVEYNMYICFFK